MIKYFNIFYYIINLLIKYNLINISIFSKHSIKSNHQILIKINNFDL